MSGATTRQARIESRRVPVLAAADADAETAAQYAAVDMLYA
jgi:hypothetical protein